MRPIIGMSFRCSMAACIRARLEVSGSCTITSGSSSKVMKLMRSFGLSKQRREGRREGGRGRDGEGEEARELRIVVANSL